MTRFGVCSGLLLLSGIMTLVGCASDDASASRHQPLSTVEPEAAGEHCSAGGLAVHVGVDADGNGDLEGAEITRTSYVCNGTTSTLKPVIEPIPTGDARCPFGGHVLRIERDGMTTDEVVACNGADGSQGPEGAQGPAGPQGADGAPGADAPEPVLGQFVPSQIVKGAVLTCTGTSATSFSVTCTGLKLNGLDIRFGVAEAKVVCDAVTGLGYSSARSPANVASPHLAWNAGGWSLSTGSVSPMESLTCNR